MSRSWNKMCTINLFFNIQQYTEGLVCGFARAALQQSGFFGSV